MLEERHTPPIEHGIDIGDFVSKPPDKRIHRPRTLAPRDSEKATRALDRALEVARAKEQAELAKAIAAEGDFTEEETEEMRENIEYLKELRADFKAAGEVVGNLPSGKYDLKEKKWLAGLISEYKGATKMLEALDRQIVDQEASLHRRDLIIASRRRKAA
jgi:hypothetical protein